MGERWEEGRRAEGMVKALNRKGLRVEVRVGLKMEGEGYTEGKRTMKELGGEVSGRMREREGMRVGRG